MTPSCGAMRAGGLHPAERDRSSRPFRKGFYFWLGQPTLSQRSSHRDEFWAKHPPVAQHRVALILQAPNTEEPNTYTEK